MKQICSLILALFLTLFTATGQDFRLPPPTKEEGEVRVLCIGNSFTYYNGCDAMLADIAASQGLRLQIGKHLKGSQTLGMHLKLENTLKAIEAGGYDFALLQEQSITPAKYSRDGYLQTYDDLKSMIRLIKTYSPDAVIILERTWSYPGSQAGGFGTMEDLDRHLERGTKKMARKAHIRRSPIGNAFNAVRKERPDIVLLDPDEVHQSPEGAYLKACVNYLVITGKAFEGDVDCCGIEPQIAEYLRSVAEKTTLYRK